MSQLARPAAHPDLWIDITTPAPIGIDPLFSILGIDLEAVLRRVLRSAVYVSNGQRYYPIKLVPKDDARAMLGKFGAFAVVNGMVLGEARVVIMIPPDLKGPFESRVPVEVRGQGRPGNIPPPDRDGPVSPAVAYALKLEPGDGASLPLLGRFGDLGIRLSPEQPGDRK